MTEDGKAKGILNEFFACLGERGDSAGLLALLNNNVIVDTPFAPNGQPNRFEGIDQVAARFAGARDTMKTFAFYDIRVLATEDPELWLATCRSRGESVDGLPYENSYCWIFRISGGQIVSWTEYYDPQPLMPFLDAISVAGQ